MPYTKLAHAGCDVDPITGALTPPVHFATTYEREPDGSYPKEYVYARWANPTRRLLETTLADLEGGADARAFASGMAAVQAILQCLAPGDHVILPDDVYHGVRSLFRTFFGDWGLTWTEVDQTDLDAVASAFRPETKLLWAETPSNPLVKITDLAGLAALGKAHGVPLIVDGTWTTPVLQRPLDLGADFVLHSLTKYIAGHSDVLAGGLVTADETHPIWTRIQALTMGAGAVADPFSSWLTLRGMRSLGARMRMHCSNARHVADFLAQHPNVTAVYYPGLPAHPGHDIARRQMTDFGGMLSFEVAGTETDALAVTGRVQVFTRATSLGGTESLIEHRASIESKPTTTPVTLIRLSIGL
ncbi:MAG: aminotransferase class I/II-fold pyridoxal phosphate-dependent enzyme, partial [Bacteroidota bacterium]